MSLAESADLGSFKRRDMDEHIFVATVLRDEAVQKCNIRILFKKLMFPETDALAHIISDTIRALFKRRLVDRVLHVWVEMTHGLEFPRRDQIEPSMLGEDWANCLVIAVQSPFS